MDNIKYILINEAGTQNAARAICNCKLPHIGQCIVCDASSTFQGSRGARAKLLNELVRLRKHHTDARILGVGELGEHCVHPSETMNALRRELSDLP